MSSSTKPPEIPWFIPTIQVKLPDGSTLVKPGKAVQRGTAVQVSKWTQLSTKTLKRLAEAGFIRESKPTPWKLFYYPAEVEEFIAKTEADPAFWDEVKLKAFTAARHGKNPKNNARNLRDPDLF